MLSECSSQTNQDDSSVNNCPSGVPRKVEFAGDLKNSLYDEDS